MGGESTVPGTAEYDKRSEENQEQSREQTEYNIATSKEQKSRSDERYAIDTAAADKRTAATDAVVADQTALADDSSEWARSDRERWETTFKPVEDDLVNEFWDYSSDERRDLEMGRAQASVAQQFEQQRAAATRNLESYGINPAATRYAALDLDYRLKQAAASAAAGNQAYQDVEDTRRELRTEAIALGKDTSNRVDTYTDNANQGWNSATNNQNQTAATNADIVGTGDTWSDNAAVFSGAGNASTSTGSGTLDDQRKNTIAQYDTEEENNTTTEEGLLTAAGMAAGMGSKAYFGASGGAIPDPESGNVKTPGGAIPTSASASGGEQVDDVDAKLTAGEFVIPVDVVKWKGEEFFQKLIEQARSRNSEAKAKPEEKMAQVGPPTFQSTPSALPAR